MHLNGSVAIFRKLSWNCYACDPENFRQLNVAVHCFGVLVIFVPFKNTYIGYRSEDGTLNSKYHGGEISHLFMLSFEINVKMDVCTSLRNIEQDNL